MKFKLYTFVLLLYPFLIVSELSAQFQNIRISTLQKTDPNEVTIAVNPVNGAYLAAGANMRYIYTSNDSGKTWQESTITSTLGTAGDPCLIYDALGNLYYGHLSYPISGNWLDRIVVQKSTKNGITWNDGAGIGFNSTKDQDKEWMISDNTNSPFKNNLYISWTEFDGYDSRRLGDSTRIRLSYSTDSGITWSRPAVVSDRAGDCVDDDQTVEGAVPAVGPDGEVYVSWSGWNEIMFDKSLDGGRNFGSDVFVANQPNGWAYDIPGIQRCNGMPITLCDISNSPFRGNVYIIWGDTRNGTSDADVFCIKSTNRGNTWGQTIRVNNDNSKKNQFFPWATIDQTTGFIYVVFYDRRNYIDNQTDVYLAVSKDGGTTFQNIKISSSPFNPVANVFFGDYTGITAHDGNIYPVWTRMDNGVMSVWTARIQQKMIVGLSDEKGEDIPAGYELLQNYPNPFNPATNISFRIPVQSRVVIKIYDLNGKEVATAFDGVKQAGSHLITYDASSLSSGRYFYELRAGGIILKGKMVLQK